MRIIVGLGNPGCAYAGTRHNVGFVVVDELAKRWRMPLGRVSDGLRAGHGHLAGESVTLVTPQMYMNLSGPAVMQLRPLVATDLIVLHDDLDLDLGCVRVKRGGGTAGHHGLDSIAAHLGADFTRVRVGIGRPPRGADVAAFVLSPFERDERDTVEEAVQRAADAVECVVRDGAETAMSRFNVRTNSRPVAAEAPIGRK